MAGSWLSVRSLAANSVAARSSKRICFQVLCFLFTEKIRLTLDRQREERQDITFHIKSGKTKRVKSQDANFHEEREERQEDIQREKD